MTHRQRLDIRSIAGAVMLAMTVTLCAQAQGLRDSVKIRISYSGLYDNSIEDVRFLTYLGRILPRQTIALPAGDYVEEVLMDRIRVAAGQDAMARGRATKVLVDSFSTEFLRINQAVAKSRKLDSGTYALMSIPPQAVWTKGQLSPTSHFPEILAASASLNPSTLPLGEQAFRVAAAPPNRVSAPRVLELTVSRGEAPQIVAALDSFRTIAFRVIGDFEYRHAVAVQPDPAQAVERPLAPASADVIRDLLRAPTRSHVPLVLLETGWPSAEIADRSCQRMSAILANVRRSWGIPDPSRPLCDAATYADPPAAETHSREILSAVQPLERLAPDAVDVIFVPLSRAQGADRLLHEIVRVAELLDVKIDALRDASAKRSPILGLCRYVRANKHTWPGCGPRFPIPDSHVLHADSAATQVINLLPAEVTGNSTSNRYRSATSLLQDLHQVLGWNSLRDSTGAIISISWTTDAASGEIRTHLAPVENVLVIAAVGNDNKVVTDPTMQLDYGSRATGGTGVVAAVNVDDARRLTCTSSVVDTLPTSTLHREDVVAFDGGVTGACGNSFSAPRIAWFAAAAEALRPTPFNHKQWLGDLTDLFRNARQTRTPALKDLVLDPVLFLTAASKGGFPNK